MITTGRYWKRELAKVSVRLARRNVQTRWTEASTAALERDVFLAAFSVRKLLDARLLSTRATNLQVTAVFYPRLAGVSLSASLPHFSHHYDVGAGTIAKVRLRELMNQFIHSHHFSAFVPFGKGMMGIFYASDTERKKCLWYVTVAALAGAFTAASE